MTARGATMPRCQGCGRVLPVGPPHPLTAIRQERGWSCERLARLIAWEAARAGRGMATERQKVWRWEHRGVTPDRDAQLALARLLRVPEVQVTASPWPAWLPVDMAEARS